MSPGCDGCDRSRAKLPDPASATGRIAIRIESPAGRIVLAAVFTAVCALILVFADFAAAHNVTREDAARISGQGGTQFLLYVYLGAKHMITGYDHLLFLVGVVFYLRTLKTITIFVSLFALGHSLTLLLGVLGDIHASPYLVDAVIGLSVAYKGFDNIGGFTAFLGGRPNEKAAVFGFGLFHGLGLGTKLQMLNLSRDGLITNMIAFNIGVEIGQLAALVVIVLLLRQARIVRDNALLGMSVNVALVLAGIALATYQFGLYVHGP